jgi:hypothetical protein
MTQQFLALMDPLDRQTRRIAAAIGAEQRDERRAPAIPLGKEIYENR